jgi:hypothetical protein
MEGLHERHPEPGLRDVSDEVDLRTPQKHGKKDRSRGLTKFDTFVLLSGGDPRRSTSPWMHARVDGSERRGAAECDVGTPMALFFAGKWGVWLHRVKHVSV